MYREAVSDKSGVSHAIDLVAANCDAGYFALFDFPAHSILHNGKQVFNSAPLEL
jgi:hypothetical protein